MKAQVQLLTCVVMLAFAGNSLLCRLALVETSLDAASFTLIRLVSGAMVLWLLSGRPLQGRRLEGDWWAAIALFAYAAGFSFAYVGLHTGTGALLLFCAVQLTMIISGLVFGESLHRQQICGLVLALGGLFYLLLPGATAPSAGHALMMGAAGFAWGGYSLRGRKATRPLLATSGNFLRAVIFAILLSLFTLPDLSFELTGVIFAILSGAVTSGLGYALWYKVLPLMRAATAGIVQLSVPVLAAVGGVYFLNEPITTRLVFSAAAILGGILLATMPEKRTIEEGED